MSLKSLLFVPGDSVRKMERALASRASVVIIDLEDAVAPGAKVEARERARDILASAPSRRIAVRINAQDTHWYRDDLIAMAAVRPNYIMLPKCRGIANLIQMDQELALLEHIYGITQGDIRLLPLVSEDALSVANLDYRGAPARTAALCFAAEDLASDLAITARDEQGRLNPAIAHVRIATRLAAQAAGLSAIDTPFPDPRREDRLRIEAAGAAETGFAGKLCIHPGQIAAIEEIFTPPADKIVWADAVIAAFADASASGVAVVNGQMVDKAHLRLAEQLRAQAG